MQAAMTPTRTTFGALPAVHIRSQDGASAIVSLYGAHVLSWQTADGRERLFCSKHSKLDGSKAIRGGIPLIFPQFAEQGTGQRHGFARTSEWQVEEVGIGENGSAFAEFVLLTQNLSPEIAAAYPCRLRWRVSVQGQKLDMQCQVDNLGTQVVSFACALHTYFAVDDVATTQVLGLQDLSYIEMGQAGWQSEAALHIPEKIDRQYLQVPRPLRIESATAALNWQQSGFVDCVVWNPGAHDAEQLSDLGDEEYRQFICVEAAMLTPYSLYAGQSWIGRHSLLASTTTTESQT